MHSQGREYWLRVATKISLTPHLSLSLSFSLSLSLSFSFSLFLFLSLSLSLLLTHYPLYALSTFKLTWCSRSAPQGFWPFPNLGVAVPGSLQNPDVFGSRLAIPPVANVSDCVWRFCLAARGRGRWDRGCCCASRPVSSVLRWKTAAVRSAAVAIWAATGHSALQKALPNGHCCSPRIEWTISSRPVTTNPWTSSHS